MKWFKISDQLPPELHDVLVWARVNHISYFFMIARWRNDYIDGLDDPEENKPTWLWDRCEFNGGGDRPEPICWMPLDGLYQKLPLID